MQKWIYKNKNKKGFTLIELVVVIAILGILSAIAIPRLSGARDTAKDKANTANMRTLESALQIYALDNNIEYSAIAMSDAGLITAPTPPTDATKTFLPNYVKEMPTSPYDNTETYTKAATGDVVAE